MQFGNLNYGSDFGVDKCTSFVSTANFQREIQLTSFDCFIYMYGPLSKRVVCLYITIQYCQMTYLRQAKRISESFSIMTVSITDRKNHFAIENASCGYDAMLIIHSSAQRWRIQLCCGFKHTDSIAMNDSWALWQTTLLCYAWYVRTTCLVTAASGWSSGVITVSV